MSDTTQGTQGEPATPAVQGTQPTTQAPSAQPDADMAKLLAKLEALESDNKKYRDERRANQSKQQALLEEQGQFKALADERAAMLEELNAKVAELESLRSQAEAWAKHQRTLAARIDERAKALTDDERADLATISSLDARERMLERLLGKTQQVQKPPTTGAPSHTSGGTSFEGLPPNQLAEAVKADPKGWREHIASLAKGRGRTRFG